MTKIELGVLRSEFDEFKDNCAKSDDIHDKYATLLAAHSRARQSHTKTQQNLREARKDNEYLMTQLAQANLKLKEYEEAKSMDKYPADAQEE